MSVQCPRNDIEAMTCYGPKLQAVGQDAATFAHFLGLTGLWVRGRSSHRLDLCF